MEYFKDILGTRVIDKETIVNLTKSIRVKDIIEDIHTEKYQIIDGDTLETISYNIYGDIKYWWVIALINDIHDPYNDLPLAYTPLKKWFDILVVNGELTSRDWQTFVDANNAKRDIKVLKQKYIAEFIYIVERKLREQ